MEKVIEIVKKRIADLKQHKDMSILGTEKFLVDARIADMQYLLKEFIDLQKEQDD